MDEVIADTYAKFNELYAEEFGRPLRPEAYHGKKIYDLPGVGHLRNRMHDPGFFRHLPVMDHAVEVLQELQTDYDIWITTAATEFRNCIVDKYDWLGEHFPFIHWSRFVFCGDKSILRGDYMIDDKARNLAPFPGKKLLFTASHNVHETDFTRVNNWLDVQAFFHAETKLTPHE